MKKINLIFILFVCHFTLNAQVSEYFPLETINFEDNTWEYTIDSTQPNNIWQVGTPSKNIFNSAYSLPLAIITDSINFYPTNNSSSFIIEYDSTDANCGTYFSFFHKYDTDSLNDICKIEYSIDTGQTWQAAKDTFINNQYSVCEFLWDFPLSYYNSSLSDNGMVSGHSHSWNEARYNMQWFIPILKKNYWPPKVMLKFTFISDEIQENKEGWIIDNIEIGSFTCYGNIEEQNKRNLFISTFPNPAGSNITFKKASNIGLGRISIFSSTGEKLSVFNLQEEDFKLDLQNFEKGIYFWEAIFPDKQREAGKFIVK